MKPPKWIPLLLRCLGLLVLAAAVALAVIEGIPWMLAEEVGVEEAVSDD